MTDSPKHFWIRKGSDGWAYERVDDDGNISINLGTDNFYDKISYVPAINGIHVIEHAAFAEAKEIIREMREVLENAHDEFVEHLNSGSKCFHCGLVKNEIKQTLDSVAERIKRLEGT